MGDTSLLEWLRHYGRVLVIFMALGALSGAAFRAVVPREYEAASILIETTGAIAPRNLGPVAIALFRSSPVYRRAFLRLDSPQASREFLDRHAELRPVAGTNLVLVVGRSQSLALAREISFEMARALSEAAEQRSDLLRFEIFQGPRASPIGSGPTDQVLLIIGMSAGLWTGLAVSVLHYRRRQPVLSLRRALDLTGARDVTFVKGTRTGIGKLRASVSSDYLSHPGAIASVLRRRDGGEPRGPVAELVGDPGLVSEVGRLMPPEPPAGRLALRRRRVLILAGPSTDSRELATAALMLRERDVGHEGILMWVR